MTRDQRAAVNDLLRRPQPAVPPTVEQMRTGFAAMMSTMTVADGVSTAATALGGRPAVLVERERSSSPGTVLYFHGGGGVFGSPETAMSLTAGLVARSGIRSLSLDYRLAPEHPYPAALLDGLAAYRALLDGGTDPGSIGFAGDSAGGGIAVGTCLMARDAGLPVPAAVVTFSAGLDRTYSGASVDGRAAVDPFFTRETSARLGSLYLGGQDPDQDLVSPAVRGDLTGFPPLLLQVGTNEILLDDSTRMAERARAAGVDVVLDVTADVPHVFQSFTGMLDEADRALDRAALFLAQHLTAAGTGRSR